MAAIGLSAAVLERRDPGAVMGSLAADHVIRRRDAFTGAVRTTVEVAADGWFTTRTQAHQVKQAVARLMAAQRHDTPDGRSCHR